MTVPSRPSRVEQRIAFRRLVKRNQTEMIIFSIIAS